MHPAIPVSDRYFKLLYLFLQDSSRMQTRVKIDKFDLLYSEVIFSSKLSPLIVRNFFIFVLKDNY